MKIILLFVREGYFVSCSSAGWSLLIVMFFIIGILDIDQNVCLIKTAIAPKIELIFGVIEKDVVCNFALDLNCFLLR